jgi:hypothetical protein
MGFAFYMLAALAGLAVLLISSYWRWQKLIDRERIFLAMKEASTPESMRPTGGPDLSYCARPGALSGAGYLTSFAAPMLG